MHSAPSLLILHIMLLVAWLGIDVGVFTSSFVMRRPNMSTETRMTVRRMMRALDLAPRVSLILMIPVAIALAHVTGFGLAAAPDWLLWAVGVGGLVWAGVSVVSFRATGPTGVAPSWAASFAKVDGALRAAASLFFVSSGVWSLTGGGPWNAGWVAWKSLIFGVIIAMGLWIRVAARRYHPALADLLENGESSERLAAVNERIRGVYPPVLLIWSSLVVMVILAVVRP
jgi:hypothetical protein